MEDLLLDLLNIGVFKTGEFVLKSGVESPIYIDLRTIIAFPNLVKKLSESVRKKQVELNLEADVVCGVPYTALPIASVFSVANSIPMVMKRKEAKNYGTKKMVEGVFAKGTRCLVIEDIVSSGSSIIETVEVLRKEGLVVTDCITVLNRMQGGTENLVKHGIALHALFDINQLFAKYCTVNTVEQSMIDKVKNYLKDNFIPIMQASSTIAKPFHVRSSSCKQPVLKRLFDIIAAKKSNLCVSIDVTSSSDLLRLAEKLGPHICILKTHIDILDDFTEDVTQSLRSIADSCDFLIMEDRKYADIGNTVVYQYTRGLYKTQEWADIVTVHGIPGGGLIKALSSAAKDGERACVLVAEMSSKGTLTDESYQNKVVEIAREYPDFVIGFVSQRKLIEDDNIVHMTPGVNMSAAGDSLGQQYNSPEIVVNKGADVVIVGRGICSAPNVVEAAMQYKTVAYEAYVKKCKV